MGLVSVLLLTSAILGVIGYKSCGEVPLSVPVPHSSRSAAPPPNPGGNIPSDAGALQPDASQDTLELGVTNTRLYQYAGTMDVENRYASTVMISTDSESMSARCSGVLISHRVVLTAASCLCESSKSPPPANSNSLPDASASCLQRVVVTTAIYGEVLDKKFPESTTRMSFHNYDGEVRPHPAFKFASDDAGVPGSAQADLAVVVLDEAVKDVEPEALMEQGEFQAHDPLIMAGYASSGTKQAVGGLYGIRYFRQNTVTQSLPREQGRILYQQHGPFIYNGYAGGPCFREDSHRRLLAGVAGTGGGRELSFTSVPLFLDWVQAQIRGEPPSNSPAPRR